jgi:hypothetical protein
VLRGEDEVVGEEICEGGVEADKDVAAGGGYGGGEDETADEGGFSWREVGRVRSEESS